MKMSKGDEMRTKMIDLDVARNRKVLCEALATMKAIAYVQPNTLSDKSVAFDVIVPRNKEADIQRGFKIGALNKMHAEAIAEALNNGVAWIDIGE